MQRKISDLQKPIWLYIGSLYISQLTGVRIASIYICGKTEVSEVKLLESEIVGVENFDDRTESNMPLAVNVCCCNLLWFKALYVWPYF